MIKKNQKKKGFLDFLRKSSYFFVWDWCKTNVLTVFYHSAKTTCLGKIWVLSDDQKWLSANEISVFLNRQYFINILICDFDF